MKAWGDSKKIFRGDDLPAVERWQIDEFSGGSVQRPYQRMKLKAAQVETAVIDAPPPSPSEPDEATLEAQRLAQAMAEEAARAAELAAIRDAARSEGYQAGFNEGQTAGYSAGEAAGREAGYAIGFEGGQQQGRSQAEEELGRFRELFTQLDLAVQAYEERLAQPIVDLALAAAQQLVRGALQTEPARLVDVIREALQSLPELQGPLRLELHPDDVELVQTLMATDVEQAPWRLDANPTVARGGCRIANAVVEVDLTLATRWRRIVEALGRNDAWASGDAPD